jgi:hypothetical protein
VSQIPYNDLSSVPASASTLEALRQRGMDDKDARTSDIAEAAIANEVGGDLATMGAGKASHSLLQRTALFNIQHSTAELGPEQQQRSS